MNLVVINDYVMYSKTPNTIDKKARIFTKSFYFNTLNDFTKRTVRVYLPSTYDFNNPRKRYSVLYMFDGKNLFDDYTSFVGEWKIDEIIENSIKNKESEGIIVVGIDAPGTDVDRSEEMSPNDIIIKNKKIKRGYIDLLLDFVVDEVKKDIDKTFFTKKDRNHTFVGGSSMGGLASWYFLSHRSDVFSVALCYSSAFFLLNKKSLMDYVEKDAKTNKGKYLFFVGGVGFENIFIKDVVDVYKTYKKNKVDTYLILDTSKEHNEKAWSEYFLAFYKHLI